MSRTGNRSDSFSGIFRPVGGPVCFVLMAACGLLAAASANGQSPAFHEIRSIEHDLGTIEADTAWTATVEVSNPHDDALRLSDARESHEHISVSLPDHPIAPGQTGEVAVEFRSGAESVPSIFIIEMSSEAAGESVKPVTRIVLAGEPDGDSRACDDASLLDTNGPRVSLRDLAHQWSIGHEEEAVCNLLRINEADDRLSRLRLFEMSESSMLSTEDGIYQKKFEAVSAFEETWRDFVSGLARFVTDLERRGEHERAERILAAMQRVEDAHPEGEVSRYGRLVASRVFGLAERLEERLDLRGD